ncbi:TIGR03759 family integrating conjugative element protein, partial [Xenorhabdus sp. Vera]|nr:TIGR03759 family integrating conjugative element protein [Xenorhabdus sp. Vera]
MKLNRMGLMAWIVLSSPAWAETLAPLTSQQTPS